MVIKSMGYTFFYFTCAIKVIINTSINESMNTEQKTEAKWKLCQMIHTPYSKTVYTYQYKTASSCIL